MNDKDRTVLITGANRGLGFATAEKLAGNGYQVIMCGRDAEKIEEVAVTLKKKGLKVAGRKLDVTDDSDLAALEKDVKTGRVVVDILVNCAGVFIEPYSGEDSSIFHASEATIKKTFQTNTFGPLCLIQILVPGMKKRGWGRVVNVSSGMGGLTEMGGYTPAYRMSKAALNAITRITAVETEGSGVLVNSVCPGWVRTDMGGPSATRSIEEGIAGIVWAATLPDGGPTGGFFRDGEQIEF